jgi:Coenzyme PQQ synthesis protein D (PqqD)
LIGSESTVRPDPQVVARDTAEGEGGVLLHLTSGQYHGVNPVGLAIWELMKDGCTVSDLVDRLRDRVEDPPPSLEDDVLFFLTSIRDRDLIIVE